MLFVRGSAEIGELYNTRDGVSKLKHSWAKRVTKGGVFCPSGACNFAPGDVFEYDVDNFLYYRALALRANISNINGDLFPHDQLTPSYKSFIGKGVYFNHNSNNPENAFGIILDAAYTPCLFGEDYDDKYVEILAALDRRVTEHKHPGLLRDIESRRITATSMGTTAQKAVCSICGSVAYTPADLCEHCDPQSPFFCKGRTFNGIVDGKYITAKCFETNYGLNFIEDSIVYVPAEQDAHMFEIYASANVAHIAPLVDLFRTYSNFVGRHVQDEPIVLISSFKNTGGLMATAAEKDPNAASGGQQAPAPVPAPAPAAAQTPAAAPQKKAPPVPPPAQPKKEEKKPETAGTVVSDMKETVDDKTQQYLDSSVSRHISTMIQQELAPFMKALLETLSPQLRDEVKRKTEQAKAEIKALVPNVKDPGSAQPASTAKPADQTGAPAAAPAAGAPQALGATSAVKLQFTEDFSRWTPEQRAQLISRIAACGQHTFDGILELENKE